jgi:TRAP-type C4-dicarboxylate transport system permease small subunit
MEKIAKYYGKFEDFLTNLLMIGIVIFVFVASVLRWAGHPIAWTVGFSQFLFVWVIFLGANKTLRLNKHIGVDFFAKRLPERVRILIELIIYLLMLLFLIFVGINGLQLSLDNSSRTISNLSISYSYVTLSVPISCFLMCITILSKSVSRIKKIVRLNTNQVSVENKKARGE